jgi:glycosyltransferase involved in cell wall biosynthesis
MKTIRIMRIIARLNVGGPAIQAISLTRVFSQKPYSSLLVCGQVEKNEKDMSYLAKQEGIRPWVLPELGRELSLLGDLKAFARLRGMIRRYRPQIIHSHTAKAGTLGRVAAMGLNIFRRKQDRIKLVHTFHGHFFHSYFGWFKTWVFLQIERFLARFTDRIVVISPEQKKDIGERYRVAPIEKISVVPLGFNLERFSSYRGQKRDIREKVLPPGFRDTFLVGLVGRLTEVKNHGMLLKAIRYLRDRGEHNPFRFLIVGGGELMEELLQWTREWGIEDLVHFMGWQRDLLSLYHAMDAVVLTSLNEGTPVSLIEAMAAGRIVVATDVGGVRDLFGAVPEPTDSGITLAQNGILIPSGRSDLLAGSLIFILENRAAAKKMAGAAREFVLKAYGLERLHRDLDALYSGLVKEKG